MTVLLFFGVVILFSLTLCIIEKVHAYYKHDGHTIWEDADNVVIKDADSNGPLGGFGTRIDNLYQESLHD